mmetsp:Transcript_70330/g.125205  ORF Transcript_70330/g.125205 Transcript_70330/m.125205 type:complete len:233 (-) Transcript_70330:79-777(-)
MKCAIHESSAGSDSAILPVISGLHGAGLGPDWGRCCSSSGSNSFGSSGSAPGCGIVSAAALCTPLTLREWGKETFGLREWASVLLLSAAGLACLPFKSVSASSVSLSHCCGCVLNSPQYLVAPTSRNPYLVNSKSSSKLGCSNISNPRLNSVWNSAMGRSFGSSPNGFSSSEDISCRLIKELAARKVSKNATRGCDVQLTISTGISARSGRNIMRQACEYGKGNGMDMISKM